MSGSTGAKRPESVSVADAFVGREWERADVAAAVADAVAGRGGLVLISGEAGVGKTCLTREAAAAASGCEVVWAACWDGDDGPPYWPWMQVTRSLIGGVAAGDLDGSRFDRSALSPLLGEQAHDAGLQELQDPAVGRIRLFDTTVDLLAATAQRHPVMIVIDDIHWADEPSLMLLRHVTSRLAELRVAIVATYRDDPEAAPRTCTSARANCGTISAPGPEAPPHSSHVSGWTGRTRKSAS